MNIHIAACRGRLLRQFSSVTRKDFPPFDLALPYSLRLRFNDGLTRTIDFEPILEGELDGPPHDPQIFAQVSLDPEIHTAVWPCGAGFDPATLHDWPDHDAGA